MPVQAVERKLAAIFAADIAGYSRLMGADEEGTLARPKMCREVIDRAIANHRGRIFNTAGDSVVADFVSAVDAMQCAVAVQEELAKEASDAPEGDAMRFRIGQDLRDAVRPLTVWGAAYRYPGTEDIAEPVPDEAELRRTIDLIERLGERLRAAMAADDSRAPQQWPPLAALAAILAADVAGCSRLMGAYAQFGAEARVKRDNLDRRTAPLLALWS